MKWNNESDSDRHSWSVIMHYVNTCWNWKCWNIAAKNGSSRKMNFEDSRKIGMWRTEVLSWFQTPFQNFTTHFNEVNSVNFTVLMFCLLRWLSILALLTLELPCTSYVRMYTVSKRLDVGKDQTRGIPRKSFQIFQRITGVLVLTQQVSTWIGKYCVSSCRFDEGHFTLLQDWHAMTQTT